MYINNFFFPKEYFCCKIYSWAYPYKNIFSLGVYKMNSFKAKVRYKFDNLMSKGTIALVGVLFLATAAVILVAGIVAYLLGNGSVGQNVWASVMHTIDAGTITGTETGNIGFVILMSVVTLCGLFVTSILIGIITTGFEGKLQSLRKGNSRVIEKDHTVILGYDDNVYTIISELVIANENRKNAAIVVLSPSDKEEMEEAIADQIPDLKNTRVICRTGNITDINMLKKCSIDTCRSVILNERRDFMTIKAVLAINSFFDSCTHMEQKPPIVSLINEQANLDAALIAGQGNVEALLVGDVISRIIAQTCRQPGLSSVLIELFDYDGNELYFENFPSLAGKSFKEALSSFRYAVPFGYKRGDDIRLNPPMDEILEADDLILLLVEDDGVAKPIDHESGDVSDIMAKLEKNSSEESENILILGCNNMTPLILKELDSYFSAGSKVTLAVDTEIDFSHLTLENILLSTVNCDINSRENIEDFVKSGIDHVLLLSSDDCDTETSDAQTLLKLIHLRDIMKRDEISFNITSEMRNTTNQKLAKVAEINDLVVGSNIVNLILTQISENRDLSKVFKEILEAEGSEIYIKKAAYYAELDKPVDFYTLTQVAAERGDIAIGYKLLRNGETEIIVNPDKQSVVTLTSADEVIVLAS